MRNFDTGATRDSADGKPVFNGFLSHEVLRSYAAYMHKNRFQADGKVRSADNWKNGIPEDVYMDSMFRHFMDVWEAHEDGDRELLTESLNALLFNVMGLQYENLKSVAHIEATQAVESIDYQINYEAPPAPGGTTDYNWIATGAGFTAGEGSRDHIRFAERAKSRWND